MQRGRREEEVGVRWAEGHLPHILAAALPWYCPIDNYRDISNAYCIPFGYRFKIIPILNTGRDELQWRGGLSALGGPQGKTRRLSVVLPKCETETSLGLANSILYSNIRIGPVVKKDVMKASIMLEHDSQYAVILAFDVKIERDAQELADNLGVKIFQADIIYHLFDKFMAFREELKAKKREEFKSIAFVFNSRDPIVCGVIVEAVCRAGYRDEYREQPQAGRERQERTGSVYQDRTDTGRVAQDVRKAFRRERLPYQQGSSHLDYQYCSTLLRRQGVGRCEGAPSRPKKETGHHQWQWLRSIHHSPLPFTSSPPILTSKKFISSSLL
ncbi:unnamed protein product [Nezara viridula]|uniref:Translation initiation factor IF- 2 domain-containing protein n=1 Tax=Nezara viridula TaxID=85310 RepID=A0A9P0HEP9_NEZVI|nr:unnamed protein product [Nezara viridula]